jgi:hypothetical protein
MAKSGDLSFLAGRELAVVFVRDYMQLVLNEAVFSFLTWPVLYVDEEVIGPEEAGYHRTACGPISDRVRGAHVENDALTVDIGRTRYVVSLRPEDRIPGQGESATLDADDQGFWTW